MTTPTQRYSKTSSTLTNETAEHYTAVSGFNLPGRVSSAHISIRHLKSPAEKHTHSHFPSRPVGMTFFILYSIPALYTTICCACPSLPQHVYFSGTGACCEPVARSVWAETSAGMSQGTTITRPLAHVRTSRAPSGPAGFLIGGDHCEVATPPPASKVFYGPADPPEREKREPYWAGTGANTWWPVPGNGPVKGRQVKYC